MAFAEAGNAVRRYVVDRVGTTSKGDGDDFLRVAVALVKSEQSDRESISRWVRSGGEGESLLAGPLADAIARGVDLQQGGEP